MKKDIIFQIGETLLLEMEGVEDVAYPVEEDYPTMLIVTLADGSRCQIDIKPLH